MPTHSLGIFHTFSCSFLSKSDLDILFVFPYSLWKMSIHVWKQLQCNQTKILELSNFPLPLSLRSAVKGFYLPDGQWKLCSCPWAGSLAESQYWKSFLLLWILTPSRHIKLDVFSIFLEWIHGSPLLVFLLDDERTGIGRNHNTASERISSGLMES